MAFPYVAHMNFEAGTTAEWDAGTTDTESKLAIRHWAWLAGHGARLELPFQGAYAAHIDLSLGTADAFLQEDTLFDLGADGTLHLRFYLYAKRLTMAASDRFNVFALESAAGTNEVALSLYNNAGTIELVASETGAIAIGAGTRKAYFKQGVWHCVELYVNIDAGGGNDGTIDFYLDGYQVGAQITGLNQNVITHARLGVTGVDVGTIAGRHLLFDSVIADNTRIYPVRTRFSEQQYATKSAHLFLGRGQVTDVTLMSGAAADNRVILYDTDEANTNDPANIIVPELANDTSGQTCVYAVAPGQGYFEQGCYAVLSGTTPRAMVQVQRATTQGMPALRSFAATRRSRGIV